VASVPLSETMLPGFVHAVAPMPARFSPVPAKMFPVDATPYARRSRPVVPSLVGIVSVKVPAVMVCDPKV
jgi:hypothetical protein